MAKNEWWCPTCNTYFGESEIGTEGAYQPYHKPCYRDISNCIESPYNTPQPEKKLYPRVWATLEKTGVSRLEVPEGWLLYFEGTKSEHFIFMPDPNHEWELEPEEKS